MALFLEHHLTKLFFMVLGLDLSFTCLFSWLLGMKVATFDLAN